MSVETFTPPANRGIITVVVMLGTLMSVLDSTIANVALPHMAGSVSASEDEITWVLTSYIIAMAIMTPTTGWLSARFGRKQLFLVAVTGFTISSALCGAAQTLGQIVIFRFLQGSFGAALSPLSQSEMLDNYTMEERGRVMALWGMGIAGGPVIGPLLGGWLTDLFSWRAVFYINVPIGIACATGLLVFMPGRRGAPRSRFDVTGFALLGLAVASLQLVLDRGGERDWFQSREIVIEASVSAVSAILFLVHTLTTERPFLPLALFKDFNFVAATLLNISNSSLSFAALALVAPMTETTLGFPVLVAGWTMAPRGMGAMISIFLCGRLVDRLDNRMMILFGLALYAWAFSIMSHYSPLMDAAYVAQTGFLQGFAQGFIFLPATTMAFVTLDPKLRPDATGAVTLFRNLGSSCGISVMQALYVRNVQVMHSSLVERLTPDNPMAHAPYLARPFSLVTPAGLDALNNEVNRQASMIAYTDIFHVMSVAPLLLAPAVFFLRGRTIERSAPAVTDEALALE